MNKNTLLEINISVGEYQKLKKDLANIIDLLQKPEIVVPIDGKDLVEGLFYTTMEKGVMKRFDNCEVINGDIFDIR